MATEGTGARAARDLGQGWKISPSVRIEPGDLRAGRHRRPGRDPAHLDDADRPLALQHPAHLLGRRGRRRRSSARWATSSPAAGASTRRSPRWPSASTRAAPSTATGRCRSASAAAITMENIADEDDDALLPDQLHADRGAGRRGLLPRPVPPRQPAALQAGLHDPRRRARGRASTSAPTWPGASTTAAGGARARSSSTWTATASSPRSAAPAPRTTSAAPTTSTNKAERQLPASSPRPTPGSAQVIRPDGALRLAAALRHVPLAHHGPDPLRAGPAGDDPGARLASRTAATCRCRTTSPRSPTGTRRSRTRPSRRCRRGTSWRSCSATQRRACRARSSQPSSIPRPPIGVIAPGHRGAPRAMA